MQYLLACDVPAQTPSSSAAEYDAALKILWAAASSQFTADLPSLAEAEELLGALDEEALVASGRVAKAFPFMQDLLTDFRKLKADNAKRLAAQQDKLAGKYARYLTASQEQKARRAELVGEAHKLLRELAGARERYGLTYSTLARHRDPYSQAYRNIINIGSSDWVGVGGPILRSQLWALDCTTLASNKEVAAVWCALLPWKYAETKTLKLLQVEPMHMEPLKKFLTQTSPTEPARLLRPLFVEDLRSLPSPVRSGLEGAELARLVLFVLLTQGRNAPVRIPSCLLGVRECAHA